MHEHWNLMLEVGNRIMLKRIRVYNNCEIEYPEIKSDADKEKWNALNWNNVVDKWISMFIN